MVSVLTAFIMAIGIAAMVLCGVLAGGWLVFRSKAQPGEGLFRTPKGEVFVTSGIDDVADFPEEAPPENHLKRVNDFLSTFTAGDKP